ncbi:hypothetical protein [Helicobacter bizzozeronii]|nr:hypothetical protein [Helicobacter bizzozeronii]
MQNTLNQLTQQLKATKRAHRLFLSLAEDVGGGGVMPSKRKLTI